MASVTVPQQFSDYYNQLSNMLNNSTNVQQQSASTLKDSLSKIMQPSYQKEITARQKTAKSNKAAIDADAASRGIGSSTWVTDAKSRQNDAAASDIAGIRSDYNSALYSALMNRLSAQDEMNLNARLQAQNNAMSGANTLYQQWLAQQQAAANSGGGYSYSPGRTGKPGTTDEDLSGYGIDGIATRTASDVRNSGYKLVTENGSIKYVPINQTTTTTTTKNSNYYKNQENQAKAKSGSSGFGGNSGRK